MESDCFDAVVRTVSDRLTRRGVPRIGAGAAAGGATLGASVLGGEAFLDAPGFTPANPPDAALLVQTDAGEDVGVLELFGPQYAERRHAEGQTAIVTYDVKILTDDQEAGLAFLAARQLDGDLAASFGPAYLFIDDCTDQEVFCFNSLGTVTIGSLGTKGTYWSLDECNQTFPACEGRCGAGWNGTTKDMPPHDWLFFNC